MSVCGSASAISRPIRSCAAAKQVNSAGQRGQAVGEVLRAVLTDPELGLSVEQIAAAPDPSRRHLGLTGPPAVALDAGRAWTVRLVAGQVPQTAAEAVTEPDASVGRARRRRLPRRLGSPVGCRGQRRWRLGGRRSGRLNFVGARLRLRRPNEAGPPAHPFRRRRRTHPGRPYTGRQLVGQRPRPQHRRHTNRATIAVHGPRQASVPRNRSKPVDGEYADHH
jgi:hypothetical protein